MVFQVEGKVALITGGASGIGFHNAMELLRNGLRGVTLMDINTSTAEEALKVIENEFGSGKAIYVKADVTKKDEVDRAFQETVDTFDNVDIVINSAGILDDAHWESEIAINLNGVINTIILAIHKYLPNYRQGEDAVILSVSSTSGLRSVYQYPIYAATKHGIVGLTKGWGQEEFFQKSKIRVLAVCPGTTNTPLIGDIWGRTLPDPIYKTEAKIYSLQEPSHLAREMVDIIKYAGPGTIWAVVDGHPAFQYVFPTIESMKGNVLSKK